MSTGQALITAESNKIKPSSKPQGVAYVSGNESYIPSDIDCETITKYDRSNVFFARTKSQQRNIIFSKPYELTVRDPNGDEDEEVTTEMKEMCDSKPVNLWTKMQLAWGDVFSYGPAIFNPVWKYDGGTYTLKELNYLPAESFDSSPMGTFKVASELLPGIGLNDQGKVQFFQNNLDGQPVELTNVVMIKEPLSKGITGTPLCLPILPIIAGLRFSMNAQMQKVNRVGAPTPFLKINNPQPGSEANGWVSDEEYAQMWLGNYSKDVIMPLRENMELVDSYMMDNGTAIETIEYLNKLIVDYWTPSSLIAKDGTLIGGSSSSEMGLLLRYISGIHEWIENAFEELLQIYLDANGYEGYRVEITIPEPEIDTTELDIQKAEKCNPVAVKVNEYREWLGLAADSNMDDVYLSALMGNVGSDYAPNTANQPLPQQSDFLNSVKDDKDNAMKAESDSVDSQKDAWETVTNSILSAIDEEV